MKIDTTGWSENATPKNSAPNVASAFANFRGATERLLTANLTAFSHEMVTQGRKSLVAVFAAAALIALALSLSLYGMVFEGAGFLARVVLPASSEPLQRLATHALVFVVVAAAGAILLHMRRQPETKKTARQVPHGAL